MPAGFKNKRVKPNLSRPSVDLDRTGVTREWRTVAVQDLDEGDIVANLGLVQAVTYTIGNDGQIMLTVGHPEVKARFYNIHDRVFAFTKKEETNWHVPH